MRMWQHFQVAVLKFFVAQVKRTKQRVFWLLTPLVDSNSSLLLPVKPLLYNSIRGSKLETGVVLQSFPFCLSYKELGSSTAVLARL